MSIEGAELEQARRPDLFVHPLTGEAVSLAEMTNDWLGGVLDDLRDHESRLREVKGDITTEVLRRMDQHAKWSVDAGIYQLKSSSPEPVEEWDALELREALLRLVDRGELAISAVDAAIEPVVTYKIRKAGITALRKLGGEVREIVNSRVKESAKRRYVTVTRIER